MKRLVSLGLLAVTGCAVHRLPPPQAPVHVPTYTEARRVDEELAREEPIREEPVQEEAVQPSTPPSDATLLAAESPEVQEAVSVVLREALAADPVLTRDFINRWRPKASAPLPAL